MARRKKEPPRFDGTLGEGQPLTIVINGFTLEARVERDEDMGPPWIEHDGHGIVSDWTSRDKKPSERILCRDDRSRRYYDVKASMDKAEEEGWDAPPYGQGTKRQQAARAVEADFQNLKAWCDDEWRWVGVVIDARKNGVLLADCAASVWGIASNSDEYLTEVANDLVEEALQAATVKCKDMIDKLLK